MQLRTLATFTAHFIYVISLIQQNTKPPQIHDFVQDVTGITCHTHAGAKPGVPGQACVKYVVFVLIIFYADMHRYHGHASLPRIVFNASNF